MITKTLTEPELRREVEHDGLMRERPWLARYILENGVPYVKSGPDSDVEMVLPGTRPRRSAAATDAPVERSAAQIERVVSPIGEKHAPDPVQDVDHSRDLAELACRSAGVTLPVARREPSQSSPVEARGDDASGDLSAEALRRIDGDADQDAMVRDEVRALFDRCGRGGGEAA